jgi:hypothetical protein
VLILIVCFAVLRQEFRNLLLPVRYSTTWAMPPSPLPFSYFFNRVSWLCLGQFEPGSSCLWFPYSWGDACATTPSLWTFAGADLKLQYFRSLPPE